MSDSDVISPQRRKKKSKLRTCTLFTAKIGYSRLHSLCELRLPRREEQEGQEEGQGREGLVKSFYELSHSVPQLGGEVAGSYNLRVVDNNSPLEDG